MVTLAAYGVAFLPVLIGAAVLLVVAVVVLRRRDRLGRASKIRLVLGVTAFLAVIYVVEGVWLGRYGLASMHLIEVCGPVDGLRSAWHNEVGAGSLDADGFFSCGTGLDDPELMCVGDAR